MNKFIILAILAVACTATLTELCSADSAGYYRINNVCQKCHVSCSTCVGAGADKCTACAVTGAVTSDSTNGGTCACPSTAAKTLVSATALECSATTPTSSDCGLGTAFVTDNCVPCNDECEQCSPDGVSNCLDATSGCWAGLTGANNACAYDAASAFIPGIDTAYNNSADTSVAVVEGYYFHTTSFQLEPCAAGCATCASLGGCTGCDTSNGFSLNSDSTACECAAGKWINSDQVCGACISGCSACSDGTTCTTCDSDHDISSADNTCVAKTTGNTTSPSTTTSGETGTGATNDEANASSNVAPAAGCADTLIGCTACDSADNTKCTTCNATYYFKLNGTVCDCVTGRAQHPTTKTCGHQCTADCGATQTCQFASGASAPACADAPTTSSGLLITAVSMIFAVILA